jgi:hypothetical protein
MRSEFPVATSKVITAPCGGAKRVGKKEHESRENKKVSNKTRPSAGEFPVLWMFSSASTTVTSPWADNKSTHDCKPSETNNLETA